MRPFDWQRRGLFRRTLGVRLLDSRTTGYALTAGAALCIILIAAANIA